MPSAAWSNSSRMRCSLRRMRSCDQLKATAMARNTPTGNSSAGLSLIQRCCGGMNSHQTSSVDSTAACSPAARPPIQEAAKTAGKKRSQT